MPAPPKFIGPRAQRRFVKLPAVDRIYTITEGKGITGPSAAEIHRVRTRRLRALPSEARSEVMHATDRLAESRTLDLALARSSRAVRAFQCRSFDSPTLA